MRALRTILTGTLVVGALDIGEVIAFYYAFRDVAPMRILQSVAAGVYGRDGARSGGWKTALVGLALHFFIAFCVFTVYYLASRRFHFLTRHPILSGIAYGLGVYIFMSWVVVPMSAIGGSGPRVWWAIANGLFAHLFCIGIPTALISRWGDGVTAAAADPYAGR